MSSVSNPGTRADTFSPLLQRRCGDYAVVGLSKPRRDGSFRGLALDEHLAERHATARCGLQVIDLRSGDAVNWLRIDGSI